MTRKRKTPDHLLKMIEWQTNFMNHTDEQIRVKLEVPVENQADHIREKTVEQMIGRAEGVNTLLEHALMDWGCWAGFQYVGKPKRVYNEDSSFTVQHTVVGHTHPEYAEWRRIYYTRS